jgi:hypothetical protein
MVLQALNTHPIINLPLLLLKLRDIAGKEGSRER